MTTKTKINNVDDDDDDYDFDRLRTRLSRRWSEQNLSRRKKIMAKQNPQKISTRGGKKKADNWSGVIFTNTIVVSSELSTKARTLSRGINAEPLEFYFKKNIFLQILNRRKNEPLG